MILIASFLYTTSYIAHAQYNNPSTNEYVLGRNLYLSFTIEKFPAGIEHLLKAVEIDPTNLRAWYTLTDAYRTGTLLLRSNIDEWKQKSQEIDDYFLGLSHVSENTTRLDQRVLAEFTTRLKGRILVDRGDWVEADGVLKRPKILESDSQRSKGRDISYGTFLLSVGRINEAVHILQRANDTNYMAAVVYSHLGKVYAAMNDFDLSFKTLDQGLNLLVLAGLDVQHRHNRWHPLLRKTALFTALSTKNEKLIAARANEVLATDLGAGEIDAEISTLLNDIPALKEALHRLWSDPVNQNGFRSETIAYWAAYVGDNELTYNALHRLPNDLASYAFWQPVMKAYRKQNGFKDLIKERGILDYWRNSGNWGDFCRHVGEDDFECE